MKTLEQEYAAAVYQKVDEFGKQHPGKDNNERTRYGVMAQKLPVLIRKAGLVQALAFVDAKATGANEKSYKQLLNDLEDVVLHEPEKTLLKKSREADMPGYIRLTRQTLLALTWFKRFSQPILGVEPTEGE